MSEVTTTKKIQWDETGSRYYETGVTNGVLYVYNSTDNKYGAGVPWNGLTSVSESPDGAEANDFYADNIKYASMRSAENFKGSIEAYTYPDEFMECDGSAAVDGVNGVYVGQQSRARFGLCYRTEVGSDTESADTDKYYKLHLIYNCSASPSEKSYESINDSPDAITFSWDIESLPVNVTNGTQKFKKTSQLTIDTRKLTDNNDNTYLKKLLQVLHGNKTCDPMLPTPDEVIALMKDGTAPSGFTFDTEAAAQGSGT